MAAPGWRLSCSGNGNVVQAGGSRYLTRPVRRAARSGPPVGQFLQVLPQGRVDFLLVIAHPEPGGGELRFSMSPAVTGRSGGMLRPSVPSILATNSLTSAISYPALNRVVEKRSGCQSVIPVPQLARSCRLPQP